MKEITRRTALTGAGAVLIAANELGSTPAKAAAPLVGKQAPAWYRMKIGSIEVTIASDGARIGPFPDNFVGNKSKDELAVALDAAFLPRDRLMLPFNPVVVNTGSKLIAIDAGFGPAVLAESGGMIGQTQNNLAAAAIDINTIDAVVISHFHGDHINGLVTDGKPSYPNAEVMVPAPEWAYWMDDGNMSRAPAARKAAFDTVRRVFGIVGDRVTTYDPGKEVAPGILSVAAYGHSPGHTVHIVQSGNSSLMIQADTTILPQLFVRHPDWHVMFDMDPLLAEQTRRRIYDQLVADRMLVHGYHFPFPSLAFIERNGTAYREAPLPWSPVI